MKRLFSVLLLLVSVSCFSQVDTRVIKGCGYSSQNDALEARGVNRIYEINADEQEVTNSSSYYYNSTSQSWCYRYTVYCTAPLNKSESPKQYAVSDKRTVIQCGYSNWQDAKSAGILAQKTAMLPDETWLTTGWDETCTSNCCYKVVFLCKAFLP